MVTLVLFSALAAAVYDPVVVGLRVANKTAEREDVRIQMTRALEQLTREATAAYNVSQSLSQRFQFDARVVDANGDGSPENRTNINYLVQSGTFQRVYNGTTVTLIPDLTSLTFTYLNSSNNVTTSPAQVRVMQVAVTATRNGEAISIATSARLRNL